MNKCKDCSLEIPEGKEHENCNKGREIDTNGMKIIEELPENMTGHIVVFEEPLLVYPKNKPSKDGFISLEQKGEPVECYFMRAEGGFGSYSCCSGRMIIGDFFKTIQDVLDNKPFQEGNTKCYPTGYIPELFTQHEKL